MPCRMVLSTCCLLAIGLTALAEDKPTDAPATARVLPGIRKDGYLQLPNQWKLNPTGRHIDVGDLPVNIQIHPSGLFAAVLHCGYKEHEIIVLDLNPRGQKIIGRTIIPQAFYGLTFTPDGKQIYASGGEYDRVHLWDFDKGLLHNARTISISESKQRMVAGGLSFDAAGANLFVAAVWGDAVVKVPMANPDNRTVIKLSSTLTKAETPRGDPPSPPDGRREPGEVDLDLQGTAPAKNNTYPYTILPSKDGKRLFVSLWGNAKIAVIDLETDKVVAGWPCSEHPTEMVLSPDGTTLYVSCSNSTKVDVFDTASGAARQSIHCALYPQAPSGNTPSSLCLTPDGEMLIVANADANNLAVFNVADPKEAKPLGFIPTGWYPTSVRYNKKDKQLYVANGKGMGSRPNRYGANPEKPKNVQEYIGSLFNGTISTMPVPTPRSMESLTKSAYACSPLKAGEAVNAAGVEADNPIPKKVGDKSPIKYVIYIIKENRTYDQIFGDIKKGNGEPELCLFPDAVTPNHHKLANDFVLLDNFYVDGEVSADGHEWSMGAYATDYVEKLWPLSYRGSPMKTFGYPSEGQIDQMARGAGGYLWDRAKEAGVTYRSYGEWIDNAPLKKDGTFGPGRATVKALEGHFDPLYRSYDLDYPDAKRCDRFIVELNRFEREGEMPRLQIVKLSNDHTAGTRIGKPTPSAMVADNDLALGRLVEAVSQSKFWKETAIFVIEDDTQNGPDHVDAHRTPALVVSPYTKRKFVDSTMYSTTSLLRTMELILGCKPMSQFDAAARPMFNSFTAKPDVSPYSHVLPRIDMNAVNKPGAVGAALSEKFDLTKEDLADDLLFNEVIWKSVKGEKSRMPAPVRSAFYVPIKARPQDDDKK